MGILLCLHELTAVRKAGREDNIPFRRGPIPVSNDLSFGPSLEYLSTLVTKLCHVAHCVLICYPAIA